MSESVNVCDSIRSSVLHDSPFWSSLPFYLSDWRRPRVDARKLDGGLVDWWTKTESGRCETAAATVAQTIHHSRIPSETEPAVDSIGLLMQVSLVATPAARTEHP